MTNKSIPILNKINMLGLDVRTLNDWAVAVDGNNKLAICNIEIGKITEFAYMSIIAFNEYFVLCTENGIEELGFEIFSRYKKESLIKPDSNYTRVITYPYYSGTKSTIPVYSNMMLLENKSIELRKSKQREFMILQDDGKKYKFRIVDRQTGKLTDSNIICGETLSKDVLQVSVTGLNTLSYPLLRVYSSGKGKGIHIDRHEDYEVILK